MIAALYVETSGVYFDLEGVDPWDAERDARAYRGSHAVVAHPPCKRWGRYWSGGPSAKVRRLKGDDDGCFAAALWAVRTFGGVLEHPEASHAFAWHGLARPPKAGGWVGPDSFGGWTCCVEQGHYGHPARKATWLYAVVDHPPGLVWGPSEGLRLDEGYHSKAERDAAKLAGAPTIKRFSRAQLVNTPTAFRDELLRIVRAPTQQLGLIPH